MPSTGFLVLSLFGVRISGFRASPRNAVYDRTYLGAMASTGTAMSEQIELEDLIRDPAQHERHDDTR